MATPKAADRRTARTRRALQDALIALMRIRHYDDITIQEIADHANVGRTTFYLHYQDKNDLFLAAHHPLFAPESSPDDSDADAAPLPWLGAEPSPDLVSYFDQMKAQGNPNALLPEMVSSESSLLLGAIQRQAIQMIEARLRQHFDPAQSQFDFHALAQAMAGAQVWLVAWWMRSPTAMTAYELARTVHHLHRAMLLAALAPPR